MGQNSHIEWCDHTFNPWEGCTKVSPGCAHCYAEARNKRWAGGANWGKGAPRRRTSEANWRQPLKWNRDQAKVIATCGGDMRAEEYRNPRVFCASLADWLDDEVPIEWLADLLELIRSTPNLDWLLLTKRPENFRARVGAFAEKVSASMELQGWVYEWFHGFPPVNVWIGTTVEDQKRADERIPLLLQIPAKVLFLSCEPLLGPVEFSDVTRRSDCISKLGKLALDGIDWVICGGESGHGARPMHPDWARSLRDQCQAAEVPFFFKQWGEWMPRSQLLLACNEPAAIELVKHPKMKSAVMRRDGGIDESLGEAHTSNDADSAIYCAGKKAAGSLLDGVEHKAFPEALT